MPTLNDAFTELQAINANLQVLHTDNASIIAGQAAIVGAMAANTAAVNDVRSAVDAGTAVLKTIAKLHQVTNTVLLHLSRQTDTMICSLDAIARNTCAIHNEAHLQTGLQTVIAAAESDLLDITRTVHPAASLDLDRREALQKATEDCCPKPVEQPPCNYRPCPLPPPLDLHIRLEREKDDDK
jgi:hypothetical protein